MVVNPRQFDTINYSTYDSANVNSPPDGYVQTNSNTWELKDRLGRTIDRIEYRSDGTIKHQVGFHYPTSKVKAENWKKYDKTYDKEGNPEQTINWSYYGKSRYWSDRTITRHKSGVVYKKISEGDSKARYEITTPSGEKIKTSNPNTVRQYFEKQPDTRFRAQSPSPLYSTEYKGKVYDYTRKTGQGVGFEKGDAEGVFLPSSYKQAVKQSKVKEQFYNTYDPSRQSPVGLGSPEKKTIKPLTTPSKPPVFVPASHQEWKEWQKEHPPLYSQAPPATLDVSKGGTAKDVVLAARYTKEGVPFTFKFGEKPTRTQSLFAEATRRVEYAEAKTSEFLFPRGGFDPGGIGEKIETKLGLWEKPQEERTRIKFKSDDQIAGGMRQQLVHHPLETAATYGVGYAFGAGLSAAKYAGVRATASIPHKIKYSTSVLIGQKLFGVLPEAIMGVYTGSVGYHTLTSPKPEVTFGKEVVKLGAFSAGVKGAAPVSRRFEFLTEVERDIQTLPLLERSAVRKGFSKSKMFLTPERYVQTEVTVKGDVGIERSMVSEFGPDQFRMDVIRMKPEEFARFLHRHGKITYFPESLEPVKENAFGFAARYEVPAEIHIAQGLPKKYGFIKPSDVEVAAGRVTPTKEVVVRHEILHVTQPHYTEAQVRMLESHGDFFTPMKRPLGYTKGVLVEESLMNAQVTVSKKVGNTLFGSRKYDVKVASEKMIGQTEPGYSFRNVIEVTSPKETRVFLGGGEGKLYMENIGKATKMQTIGGQQVPKEVTEIYRVSGWEEEKIYQIGKGLSNGKLKLETVEGGVSRTQFGGKLEESHFPIYAEITGKYPRVKDTGLFTGKAKTAYVLGERHTGKSFIGSTGEVGTSSYYDIQGSKHLRHETGKGSVEGLLYPQQVPSQDLVLLYETKPDAFRYVTRPGSMGKRAQVSIGRTEVKVETPTNILGGGTRLPPITGSVSAGKAAKSVYIGSLSSSSSFVPMSFSSPQVKNTSVSGTSMVMKPISVYVSKPVNKVLSKPVDKVVTKPVDKVVTKPVDKIITKPVNKVLSKPVEKVVTKPITKPISKVVTKPISRHGSFFTPVPKTPVTPIFIHSKLNSSFDVKKRKLSKSKIRTLYTPSLFSTVSDIRASLSKKRKKKEQATGLTVRPLPKLK